MLNEELDYDKMLRESIIYAYTHSSFYRWFYKQHNIDVHNIRGLQDFDVLPVLHKEDILSFGKTSAIEESWCVRNYKNLKIVTTTGTTGRRLKVPFTRMDMRNLVKPCIDCLHWWGYKGGPINVITRDKSQNSASTLYWSSIAEITGGRTYLAEEIEKEYEVSKGETLTYINLPRLFKFLCFHQQVFEKSNLKYILTIVTPSELKTKFHVKINTELTNVNLIPIYGFTEALAIGASCPYTFKDAYVHVTQPCLLHIADHKGILRNEGKGELLYTSLGRKAFPFIKYSPGDILTLKNVDGCDCGYSGQSLRFETRLPLTVKIQYADGYFIDILKVVEVVNEIIPGSQIICVYGEHPHKHCLFLAIFIGVSKPIAEPKRKLEDKIIENIILNHLPDDKISKAGLSNLVSEWRSLFPIFFIDVDEIPVEPGASKPRLLLNLMHEEGLLKSELYRNILSKIRKY